MQSSYNTVPLASCKPSPLGLHSVRQHLGIDAIYQQYRTRFDAADLAWLIAGAYGDDLHGLVPNRFHPWWREARSAILNSTTNPAAVMLEREKFRNALQALVLDSVS